MRYFLLLFLFPSLLVAEQSILPSITVTGSGHASAKPTMAIVTIGVFARKPSAQAAMESMSQGTNKLLALAKKFSVEERDVQTSQLSLSQDYDESNKKGFIANSTFLVTLRDLDTVGTFIGTAVEDGANALQGIQFKLDNPSPLYDVAREKAYADAEQKALHLTRLAKRQLGKVLTIEEGSIQHERPEAMFRMAAASTSPSIAEGELQVNTTVTVRFALE